MGCLGSVGCLCASDTAQLELQSERVKAPASGQSLQAGDQRPGAYTRPLLSST